MDPYNKTALLLGPYKLIPLLNCIFHISITVIAGALRIPRGAGRVRLTKITGPDNSIHKKQSMVQIINPDQLCMERAIGVCLAKRCVVSDQEWQSLKSGAPNVSNCQLLMEHKKISLSGYKEIARKEGIEQSKLARLICQIAVVPTDRPGSLNDLSVFEEALRIRIAVVAASLGNLSECLVTIARNGHSSIFTW